MKKKAIKKAAEDALVAGGASGAEAWWAQNQGAYNAQRFNQPTYTLTATTNSVPSVSYNAGSLKGP